MYVGMYKVSREKIKQVVFEPNRVLKN
jgi:hypothetical protein